MILIKKYMYAVHSILNDYEKEFKTNNFHKDIKVHSIIFYFLSFSILNNL